MPVSQSELDYLDCMELHGSSLVTLIYICGSHYISLTLFDCKITLEEIMSRYLMLLYTSSPDDKAEFANTLFVIRSSSAQHANCIEQFRSLSPFYSKIQSRRIFCFATVQQMYSIKDLAGKVSHHCSTLSITAVDKVLRKKSQTLEEFQTHYTPCVYTLRGTL